MITREEARQTALELLAKKRLTGHEAGRLYMEDSFLVVRGQKGILTEKELRYMRSLVKTQEDIEIYNSYLELYKRTEIALTDGDVHALMAYTQLLDLALFIKEYLDRDVSSWTRPLDRPISTRDQLEMLLSIKLPMAKRNISQFMAYKVRMEDLSRETGVDFDMTTRNDLGIIRHGLETYNFYAGAPEVKAEKIILEKVRPDRQMIKYLQEVLFTAGDQEASDGQEA